MAAPPAASTSLKHAAIYGAVALGGALVGALLTHAVSAAARRPKAGSRLLHTMLRVGDVEKSLKFYVDVLGMKVLRRTDRPTEKYSLTFVGYEDEATGTVLELTYNYGTTQYDLGGAFGHIAVSVKSAAETCTRVAAAGYKVTRPAGPVKGGTTVIAFVEDPNGYKVELIEGSDFD